MLPDRFSYSKLLHSNLDCTRPIGGNCQGNCRVIASNIDCMRPIGGNCKGNCRVVASNATLLVW